MDKHHWKLINQFSENIKKFEVVIVHLPNVIDQLGKVIVISGPSPHQINIASLLTGPFLPIAVAEPTSQTSNPSVDKHSTQRPL